MASHRAAIAACLAIAVLAGVPASAHACRCASESTAQKFRQAPAAFTGRLLDLKESSDGRYLVHRYRVGRDYKRNLRDTIRVRTPLDTCAVPDRTVGTRYSMFLYRSEDSVRVTRKGPWTSNLCLQSTKAELEAAARGARSSGAAGSQVPCSA